MVVPSDEQWEEVIHGCRHPFESYSKSDSKWNRSYDWLDNDHQVVKVTDHFIIGAADMALLQKLANAGDDHGKFMRMLPVMADITASLTFWKQLSTYKVGTTTNAKSTMHSIHRKEFELSDFEYEGMDDEALAVLADVIKELNRCRSMYNVTKDKVYWTSMINLLPESYLQTRTWCGNYQVLRHIYKAREGHRLLNWEVFRAWCTTLPCSSLITGGTDGDKDKTPT